MNWCLSTVIKPFILKVTVLGLIEKEQAIVGEQGNTPYAERKETGSDQLENEASWAW